jgi:large subunit ribosomal protein L3
MYRLVVASIRTTPKIVRSIAASRSLASATPNTVTASTATTRCYSTTIPNPKIQKANSNLSDEEINKMIDEELANMEAEKEAKINKNWKPGYRKRPLVIAHTLEAFENEGKPVTWQPQLNRRTGVLGIKVGMMPVWDAWGERHACTVLYLDSNVVIRTFTEEEDGYLAVQIGAGERKKKNVTKPLLGHYAKYGVDENPPYLVREFRVSHKEYLPEPGTQIHARHFIPGQNVDVSGITKGKGFQGGMKKHNFSGMPASHGTSLAHRSIGSTGSCQDPGRVFKGKKMPGRMGAERVTTQNLRIIKVDRGRNLIYLKGPVPGQKGEFVEIRDAVKKPLFGTEKVENSEVFPPLPTFNFEDGIDGSGNGGFEVMMPLQKEDPFDPPVEEAV